MPFALFEPTQFLWCSRGQNTPCGLSDYKPNPNSCFTQYTNNWRAVFLFVSAFVVCGFICISLYFPRFRLHLRVSHFAERGVPVFIEHSAQLNFSSNKNPIYLLSTNMISPAAKYNQRALKRQNISQRFIIPMYEAGRLYKLNFPSSILTFTIIILMIIMMVNPQLSFCAGLALKISEPR